MSATIQDTVERQIVIPVARERVWSALTDPSQISQWFCRSVSLTLEPGAPILFRWHKGDSNRGIVVAVEPPHRFAYRWTPGDDPDQSIPLDRLPTTLVEFLLEDTPEGTRLTVIESGFAALPEAIRESAWRANAQGWIDETNELVDYLLAEHAVR